MRIFSMKKQPKMSSLIAMLFFVFLISCGGEMEQKKIKYSSLKDVSDAAWEKLSKRTFYFGHQSVGYNIIDGVQDIMKEYPKIKLNIIESHDPASMAPGTFAHSPVGKNTEPKTKIDEFSKYIDNGMGKKADAVALKLCYVDIMKETDAANLFSQYEAEVDKIRKAYPGLKVIHFTSPLTKLQSGPKAWIKKIIGRTYGGVQENINRHEYNERIRAKYQGKDPILDIAQIESTHPDGTRASFEADGKTYYSMVPEYTNDGGHLNEVGRKKVAEQLLLLLANL